MIQVHVDLAIDPAKEQEMVRYFTTVYRPAAMKFEGYVDLHMLKLTAVPVGTGPAGINYRFSITYQNEELRQKWVNSDIHQEVWGALEKTLSTHTYSILLFDVI